MSREFGPWFWWALLIALLIGACLGLLTAEWIIVPAR